ncbi:LysR family transcriptional regulator [Pseudomonas sp. GD03944]|uniref:LysR family transcriptional regulator n=1 Tax=Pseudomonas sp. GD03944 TaxID=2975409 RepID=UPI00244CF749|nr:LysR family transcriptional regulator [Pseudomonas sp. GD03944]MDH1262051.1 LysR family transcriptional regulator [Pseudomonas sp. GD03944]
MDTRRLDLNLLVTLEALLIEQNVTRAAARLHLSQPAVSAQLSRLRDVFNDPLLVPAQRGMTPTVKALELLVPLRQALDQVRATVTTHLNFEPATANLTVSIACTDYVQAALIKHLVVAMRREAPGVRIALRILDVPQLELQMTRGEVDLAVINMNGVPPALHSQHLYDERYVLIGRRGHPSLRADLTVEEFAQLEHVVVSLRGGGFSTSVDNALVARGLRRNVVLSASSFLPVPELVAQSDCVALVPRRLVEGRSEQLLCVAPPLPVEGFAIGMFWHERSDGHAGFKWVREFIALVADSRASLNSVEPAQPESSTAPGS